MDVKQIKESIGKVDLFATALRASGGYKYRKLFTGSDKEIAEFITKMGNGIKTAIVSSAVAEEMLKEPGYWDQKTRWKEYQGRLLEAILEVQKE